MVFTIVTSELSQGHLINTFHIVALGDALYHYNERSVFL